MELRKATETDIKSLTRHLQNKHIDYITIEHMKNDIKNNNLIVAIIDNSLVGCVSVVNTNFKWLGIKRLCIFNKKNMGKGIAQNLIKYATKDKGTYCITPWVDNYKMCHIVEKLGFEYQYTFNGNWKSYLKTV